MNITFLSRGNYTDFILGEMQKIHKTDLLVLSSGVFGKLDLFKELDGKSKTFYDLCLLSETLKCVIVCGCDTEICGILHKSAAVIDNGKLCGVSDMANIVDESCYSPGGGYKIYETSCGRIGLIVGEDIFFPEVTKVLSLCESDLIVNLFGKIYNHLPQLMMRAAAYSNGISICMAAEGYIQICDIRGEIVCATDASIIECNLEITKDYHLLQARCRGFYKEFFSLH